MSPDAVRTSVFEILFRFEKGGPNRLKADSLIQDALGRHPAFTETDRGFLRALTLGVLRAWFRLDAWMVQLTGRELKRIEPSVRVFLRMGLFQLAEMSHVPAYAAINSTVELAKKRKTSMKTVKFINAVLREGQRRLEAGGFSVPDSAADFTGHMLASYGWPEAWTGRLLDQYPAETVLAMAQACQTPPPLTVRVNTLKMTVADYQARLSEAELTAIPVDPDIPEGLRVAGVSGSPRQLPGYDEGWFYVQDPASMWVARLLNPRPAEVVLDLCAAPGSKTTHMAALMENQGDITAIEPKMERLKLLRENLARLGVGNAEVVQADGLTWRPVGKAPVAAGGFTEGMEAASRASMPEISNAGEGAQYDKVLIDAPCSGTGTLRRHPEILLQTPRLDLGAYRKQQSALLARGWEWLKPGGSLVYSTCSILKAENHELVATFLKAHPEAFLEFEEQRPITQNADGFYAARIRKRS